MHYRTQALSRGLAPVGEFLTEMGLKGTTPEPKLSVAKASLPQTMQVVLLEY